MNNNKKYIAILAVIIAILGAGFCLKESMNRAGNVSIYNDLQTHHQSILGNNAPFESNVIPVNFESLKEINEDIYAWIDVPDTNIHYPIVQSPTSNAYYLNHTIEKKKGLPGSIYTENYNTKDFTDFNTLIYGHDMMDGSMFKHVHKFTDSKFFKEHDTIMIYTEDQALKYKIYAAVIYDDRHIMYTYDKNNVEDCKAFIESLGSIKSYKTHFREGMTIDENSKLITLSTCTGQSNRRLLLVAELVTKDAES